MITRDEWLRRHSSSSRTMASGVREAKPYFGPVRGSTLRHALVVRTGDPEG
jgi:hypothetical protein